jgi:hypothetical protein
MFKVSGIDKEKKNFFYPIIKVMHSTNSKGQAFTRVIISNAVTYTYTEKACVAIRNNIAVKEGDYIALVGGKDIYISVNKTSKTSYNYGYLNFLCDPESVIIRSKETQEAILKSKNDDIECFQSFDTNITKDDLPF